MLLTSLSPPVSVSSRLSLLPSLSPPVSVSSRLCVLPSLSPPVSVSSCLCLLPSLSPPVSLCPPVLSPGRGSSRPETPCWSVSTATTPSARRASTSATPAPSSRRASTPGSDVTRGPWPPLTSAQPRHCYPDLRHGNEKSTACSPPSLPWTFFSFLVETWTFCGEEKQYFHERVSPPGGAQQVIETGNATRWSIRVSPNGGGVLFTTAHQANLCSEGRRQSVCWDSLLHNRRRQTHKHTHTHADTH